MADLITMLAKSNYLRFNYYSTIPVIQATGGTVTEITDGGVDYRVHTFTASGTFEVTSGDGLAEYLIVAGGGSGGISLAGGGGAGGYLSSVIGESSGNNTDPLPLLYINQNDSFTITVGGGGAVDFSGTESSIVGKYVAVGGGGGGSHIVSGATHRDGLDGGSGGGGSSCSTGPVPRGGLGGKGTYAQGNDGTRGHPSCGYGYNTAGGGGGGAGGIGGVAELRKGAYGGVGLQSKISGSLVYYAGGGGGASNTGGDSRFSKYPGGLGGLGGGGQGYGTQGGAVNGAVNTGGGGGGGSALGGSGIVIIRYPIP